MQESTVDIRVFRRYPCEVEFKLNLCGTWCAARTTDYSLTSLGLIVESSDGARCGDILDLDIDQLDIREKVRIVWTKKETDVIRMGVLRLGPIRGNLRLYRFSDLLIGFQRSLLKGVLVISQGEIRKRLFFSNGNVVFADSTAAHDRIGDILLREGRMTLKQYEMADARKKNAGERYALILIDMGVLRPAGLLPTIELQATRITEGIFSLNDASFEFVQGPLPHGIAVRLQLNLADVIYKEVRKTADVGLLKKYLPDSIVDFSGTPLNLFQNITLCEADRKLLSYIDGKTPVRELIRLASRNETETLRSLFALLETRIIELKEAGKDPAGISAPEVCDEDRLGFCELIGRVDEMHNQLRQMDYYELLEIDRQARVDEIRKAYFRAAREFHPDMHAGLPYDIKEKLVAIFSSVNNAYLTLRDYSKRAEYDRSLRLGLTADESAGGKTPGFYSVKPALDQTPGESSPDYSKNENIAIARFEEGKTAFRKGNFEEAGNLFASAIYFDGARPEYHYFYGRVLEKQGRMKESLHTLYRASELAPLNADILAEIGHVYLSLNCRLRAKGNFERALRIDPSQKIAREGMEIVSKDTEDS